jgi:acyl-coenzyme A synthetase/AMP-(fatty) acid ligase
MTTASLSRIPLRLLASVALVAGILTATVGHSPAHAGVAHEHGDQHRALTASQVAFHDAMRKLWEDHVTWTRLAIVSFADGSAGFPATAQRLLDNQSDIGNAMASFFGTPAGDHLAALLHDHITIAVALLQAAKAGDTAAFTTAKDQWYANANDIADFLNQLNPRFWPDAVMRQDMKVHLDQTLAEAADELGGNYTASVTDYEAIHQHILAMADMLSSGIFSRFPRNFH